MATAKVTRSVLSTEGQVSKEEIQTKAVIAAIEKVNKWFLMASLVFSITAAKGMTRVAEN
jgi:hypothetical protein